VTELLRAAGVLCEPPEEGQDRVAAALGLPGSPRDDDYADLFLFRLYPYASVYLGAEGKLGGEARDRVAGFWRALDLVPPPEPDHLAALLGLYAELGERGAPDEWRRALLWEHLLSWTPPYLAKVEDVGSPFYRTWAAVLREALAAEAASLGPLPTAPLAHRAAPQLELPSVVGAAAFLEQLLAPIRTGTILVQDDLVSIAGELGLGVRIAERRYVLEALLAQDAAGALGALAARAQAWAVRHESEFWSGRAAAAAALLDAAALEAAEQEVVRAR
jgi:TorA maturation chaperone TorD